MGASSLRVSSEAASSHDRDGILCDQVTVVTFYAVATRTVLSRY